MRNIFIVNPAAGQCVGDENFVKKIEDACMNVGCTYDVYVTKGILDGRDYVRRVCTKSCDGSNLRFFACGGDGTLNEVINGAYGFENVEIGCIPIGTGNDFVRNFGNVNMFNSINAQLNGTSDYIDLIKYTTCISNCKMIGYAVNMFNIGFDCNVVDAAARLKKKPFLSGSLAYLMGVLTILVEKKGADLKIVSDGEVLYDGKLLLSSVANGCFCGGGIKGSPFADLRDGFFDVSIIRDISRKKFLSLFKRYSKGTHLQVEGINRYIDYSKKRSLSIIARNKPMRLCIDGEIIDSEWVDFESIQGAIKFIIPTNHSCEKINN